MQDSNTTYSPVKFFFMIQAASLMILLAQYQLLTNWGATACTIAIMIFVPYVFIGSQLLPGRTKRIFGIYAVSVIIGVGVTLYFSFLYIPETISEWLYRNVLILVPLAIAFVLSLIIMSTYGWFLHFRRHKTNKEEKLTNNEA